VATFYVQIKRALHHYPWVTVLVENDRGIADWVAGGLAETKTTPVREVRVMARTALHKAEGMRAVIKAEEEVANGLPEEIVD